MVDGKAGFTRNRADIGTDGIIIQMCSAAAIIADEEDAIMQATGMFIGNESVGAFHAAYNITGHEEIQDAIDAVGCDPLAALLRDDVGYIVCG